MLDEKDKEKLKPFIHNHINIVGNYSFEEAERIMKGVLKNLLPMDKKLFGNI